MGIGIGVLVFKGLTIRNLTISSFGKELIAAMAEAAAHAQGVGQVARVHAVEVPEVRAIRDALGLSQQAFASAYRIPLATLRGWEQGRRHRQCLPLGHRPAA